MIRNVTGDEELFLAFAQSHDWDRAAEQLGTSPRFARVAAHLEQEAELRPREFLAKLAQDQDAQLSRDCFVWYWWQESWSWDAESFRQVREALAGAADSLQRALVDITEAHNALTREDWGTAGDLAERLNEAELTAGSAAADYVTVHAHWISGLCARAVGDEAEARDSLNLAADLAKKRDFATWPQITLDLCQSIVSLGQLKTALQLLSAPELAAHPAPSLPDGVPPTLRVIRSHLLAAQCGIELREANEAFERIVLADQALRSEPTERFMRERNQLLLESGEIEALLENFDESDDLLQAAIESFESDDVPDHEGANRARLSLARRSLRELLAHDSARFTEGLVEEAVAAECPPDLPERIALESFSLVTTTAANLERYQSVLGRIQHVTEATLLFRVLANLYTYALQFLDNYDQAMLLIRIKNLESVISPELYPQLYRDEVSARYPFAIENRLARIERERATEE